MVPIKKVRGRRRRMENKGVGRDEKCMKKRRKKGLEDREVKKHGGEE